MRHKLLITIAVVISSLAIAGCISAPEHQLYQSSATPLPRAHGDFSTYLSDTRQWLEQHRVIVSDQPQREIDANMPFALSPQHATSKGILLVHGLGDSPYSFVDIAPELVKQGFMVHTLLLPGHGSRPGDMMDISIDDWQQVVRRHVELLNREVDEIYLGGFSTGANLVTDLALKEQNVAGLLLFSPGFKADTELGKYLPVVSVFRDWLYEPPEANRYLKNFAKYDVVATNGFTQYHYSSREVQDSLKDNTFDKPVFMVLSENDSVLDVKVIRELFSQRFNHPKSRLLWYGDLPSMNDPRIIKAEKNLPEYKVSNYSHMGVLFSPENPHYGANGSYRLCRNGQSQAAYRQCRKGEPVWYSAWGHREADKPHARLTFNPQFDKMITLMAEVFSTEPITSLP